LAAAKAQVQPDAQQATAQLKALAQAKVPAPALTGKTGIPRMADLSGRIQILNAISLNYQDIE
jgi:hypothetical protein